MFYKPQMKPLNWICLFLFFLMIFFTFNALNYFIFSFKINKILMSKFTKSMNWKW